MAAALRRWDLMPFPIAEADYVEALLEFLAKDEDGELRLGGLAFRSQ